MKKLIAIILTVILSFSVIALSEEYKSMTDEELFKAMKQIRAEINSRKLSTSVIKNAVLVDTQGVKMYINDNYELSKNGILTLHVVVENSNDFDVMVSIRSSMINGWDVFSVGASCKENRKAKETLTFNISDADCSSISDIEEFLVQFAVVNMSTLDTLEKLPERQLKIY